MSYSHIRLCVRVALQQDSLPADAQTLLGFSHLKALLPLPDGPAKLSLAQEAIDQHLTVGQLRARATQEVERLGVARSDGRRPLGSDVLLVRACAALIDGLAMYAADDPRIDARIDVATPLRAVSDALAAFLSAQGGSPLGGEKGLILQAVSWIPISRENMRPPLRTPLHSS